MLGNFPQPLAGLEGTPMNIAELRTRVQTVSPSPFNDRTQLVTKTNPGHQQEASAKQDGQVENPAAVRLHTANQNEPRAGTDPVIQALVDRLPQPNAIWSIDDRGKWLKAAAMAFNLIYKTE
jgi:hypothetical protein